MPADDDWECYNNLRRRTRLQQQGEFVQGASAISATRLSNISPHSTNNLSCFAGPAPLKNTKYGAISSLEGPEGKTEPRIMFYFYNHHILCPSSSIPNQYLAFCWASSSSSSSCLSHHPLMGRTRNNLTTGIRWRDNEPQCRG